MKLTNVLTLLGLISITLLPACDSATDPPFPGGIRIITQEAIEGVSNSATRVPQVFYSGNTIGVPGPQSNDGLTSIQGFTGSRGLADNPDAMDDVQWQFTIAWYATFPACGETFPTYYINPGGATITNTCYVFSA